MMLSLTVAFCIHACWGTKAMLPETLTFPESFSSSPRIDEIRDDFPDPTVPTTLKKETY